MENDKIKREEIAKKWESLGFLDGLKGLIRDDSIAKMYECCKATVKNEETGEWECCKEDKKSNDK